VGLAGLDWYRGGEYVITDEAGLPVHPEWYSAEFGRLLRRAGLRRITLHDSRYTTLTLMEHAGVPISIVSKWAGHYDSAFTQKTYVHASDEDLQRGQVALARIHKIVGPSGESSLQTVVIPSLAAAHSQIIARCQSRGHYRGLAATIR
jgi:integrase